MKGRLKNKKAIVFTIRLQSFLMIGLWVATSVFTKIINTAKPNIIILLIDDAGHRVPFLVSWLKHLSYQKYNGLSSSLDIFPTALEAADIDKLIQVKGLGDRLYNLENDPGETKDLISSEPLVYTKLKNQLVS